MWFFSYRFERRSKRGWERKTKVKIPDRVLATLIINYLAHTDGHEYRLISGVTGHCPITPHRKINMAHASESQHWYNRDGTPAYSVTAKGTGQPRPTTLADARRLGLLPGVSTIINCAAKPALTNWLVDQGIMAALTLPRLPDELDADFVRRVKQDSQEQGRKAAERGTAIHGALQGHYEGHPPEPEHWAHVQGVYTAVSKHFTHLTWSAERSFATAMGYGGKTDLVSTCGTVLIDFKTKEFDDATAKQMAWDEHAIQLGAYRYGLRCHTATCANVFVSVSTPGLVHVHVWSEAEILRGWEMFKALLAFWKAKQKIETAFELEAAA